MVFLGHNFSSRHARRSIKGSIDAADRLVSKQILSHKNGLLDWRPEPVKVGQKFKNMPSLWRHQEKTPHLNQIFLFNRT